MGNPSVYNDEYFKSKVYLGQLKDTRLTNIHVYVCLYLTAKFLKAIMEALRSALSGCWS